MGEASRKVEGGKMVKVEVVEGDVSITGDFFMHPEQAVESVEGVVAEQLDVDAGELEDAVADHLESEDVEMLGVAPRDVAELAVEARDG